MSEKLEFAKLVSEGKILSGLTSPADRNGLKTFCKDYENLLKRSCELKAREINNSPLRGYDGMVDRYDAEIEKLQSQVIELDHAHGVYVEMYDRLIIENRNLKEKLKEKK